MRLKYSILVSLVFLFVVSCKQEYKATPLEADEFKKMVEQSPDLQLIDVRTAGEVAEGILPEAVNIDYRSPDFRSSLEKLDKSKPIAVYCAVGQRSQAAYDMLVEMKFHEVYHLSGGTRAWKSKGYELVRP